MISRKSRATAFTFTDFLFIHGQNFSKSFYLKVAKKEANQLRQVDRLCAWDVYHAKPDEATLTLRSSVLWELCSVTESSLRGGA